MRGKRYLFRRDADDAFIFCSKFFDSYARRHVQFVRFLQLGRSRRRRSLLLRRREPRRARDDGRSSRARYAHHHHHRAACFASSSSSSSSSSLWWSYFLRYKQRNWRSCIFKRYKKIRALFKRKKRRYARKTRPIRIRAPLVFGLLPLLVRRETVRFVLQNGRHEKTIRHPLLE